MGGAPEAKKLARHDPLTGLPNRRFFVEMLGCWPASRAADYSQFNCAEHNLNFKLSWNFTE